LSEGLAAELAPLGIRLTIIEPGAFRTEFLTGASAVFSRDTIDTYATTVAGEIRRFSEALNGAQGGDPARLARAIIDLSNEQEPPLRFAAGEDAVKAVEAMLESRRNSLEDNRERSLSMAIKDAASAAPR
jgi:NAD(P)-dependent dehydrogenase (short-subunit alcohol dehydrogenase family)